MAKPLFFCGVRQIYHGLTILRGVSHQSLTFAESYIVKGKLAQPVKGGGRPNKKLNTVKIMKTTLAVLLAALTWAFASEAQTNTPVAPGTQPAGCRLTPEQWNARQAERQAWRDQAPGRRGPGAGMINATGARGQGRGGQAAMGGQGRGMGGGWGLRDGTGPRAQMGLCPRQNNGGAAPAYGRGAGKGKNAMGGWGRGGGRGLRNGTGPRSANGTCPLVNPAPAAQ